MKLFSRGDSIIDKRVREVLEINRKDMEIMFDTIDKILLEHSYTHNKRKVTSLTNAQFKIKYLRAETLKKLRGYING